LVSKGIVVVEVDEDKVINDIKLNEMRFDAYKPTYLIRNTSEAV
jgi:hypothetical protein